MQLFLTSKNMKTKSTNSKFKISADGIWFYEDTIIQKFEIIKLFSSYLKRDFKGNYWLEGPYEKVPIIIEDTPFVIKEIDFKLTKNSSLCWAITNLNEKILISKKNPFQIRSNSRNNLRPYVYIRGGMYALVLRSAYYYLTEFTCIHNGWYGFWSDNYFFKLEEV